tara:strand:- start:28 stop:552 length:525 start_codon:yes stop_codon:yes gene_type:complete
MASPKSADKSMETVETVTKYASRCGFEFFSELPTTLDILIWYVVKDYMTIRDHLNAVLENIQNGLHPTTEGIIPFLQIEIALYTERISKLESAAKIMESVKIHLCLEEDLVQEIDFNAEPIEVHRQIVDLIDSAIYDNQQILESLPETSNIEKTLRESMFTELLQVRYLVSNTR